MNIRKFAAVAGLFTLVGAGTAMAETDSCQVTEFSRNAANNSIQLQVAGNAGDCVADRAVVRFLGAASILEQTMNPRSSIVVQCDNTGDQVFNNVTMTSVGSYAQSNVMLAGGVNANCEFRRLIVLAKNWEVGDYTTGKARGFILDMNPVKYVE